MLRWLRSNGHRPRSPDRRRLGRTHGVGSCPEHHDTDADARARGAAAAYSHGGTGRLSGL